VLQGTGSLDGSAQNRGHFFVRPILDKPEQDDLLLVGRQAQHGCPHPFVLQLFCNQAGWIGFGVAVQLAI